MKEKIKVEIYKKRHSIHDLSSPISVKSLFRNLEKKENQYLAGKKVIQQKAMCLLCYHTITFCVGLGANNITGNNIQAKVLLYTRNENDFWGLGININQNLLCFSDDSFHSFFLAFSKTYSVRSQRFDSNHSLICTILKVRKINNTVVDRWETYQSDLQ